MTTHSYCYLFGDAAFPVLCRCLTVVAEYFFRLHAHAVVKCQL